jgi:uncharacterized membrane protein YtjA (UPF0391 family)
MAIGFAPRGSELAESLMNCILDSSRMPLDWPSPCSYRPRRYLEMLYYALVFFVIALIAALLGFGGIAVAFAGIAKILFVVFLILFLASFVMHLSRRV